MLTLEGFMNVKDLKQQGLSVSAIAEQLDLDRKTVRKYLVAPPQPYQRREPMPAKIEPYRAFLRERWEQGVHNASKLWQEIRGRGYPGGYSQLKLLVAPWREEQRERAFVRFETEPGQQSQMDWGHFGNWDGRRLYCFGLTLCYSRMRYIEFTQRQDVNHLLHCLVHAFHYFDGVTESILTDRMKTVLLDQQGGELHFNPGFLGFAAYYGFVPKVCRPYRPETKGKIERTIGFVRQNFWPGLQFDSLDELNRKARDWMERVNRQIHGTTRQVPYDRLAQEPLLRIDEQPDYDTSYMEDRHVSKDCLLSYRGNRYSVPFRHARKTVLVREPVTGGKIEIYASGDTRIIAEHRLAEGRGATVMDPAHYENLPRRERVPKAARSSPGGGSQGQPPAGLPPGPGVGRGLVPPEVEQRSLSVYEEVADVTAI
jgi:transposase